MNIPFFIKCQIFLPPNFCLFLHFLLYILSWLLLSFSLSYSSYPMTERIRRTPLNRGRTCENRRADTQDGENDWDEVHKIHWIEETYKELLHDAGKNNLKQEALIEQVGARGGKVLACFLSYGFISQVSYKSPAISRSIRSIGPGE